MFSSPEVTVPGAVLVTAIVIGGAAYVMAPEVGTRLVAKSGAIEACEKELASRRADAAKEEASRIEIPEVPQIDGQAIGTILFGGREDSDEFLRHYGRQFQTFADAVTAPARQQAEEARKAAERKLSEIEARFQKQAESGESVCSCRARLAINNGNTALAMFTATGGWIQWAPVTDWNAAMASTEIVAQCKGVL